MIPDPRLSLTWYESLLHEAAPTLKVTLMHALALPPARGVGSREGWALYVSPGYNCKDNPIEPGRRVTVPTGIRLTVPDGYVALILPSHEVCREEKLEASADYVFPNISVEIWLHLTNLGQTTRTLRPCLKVAQFLLLKTEPHVKMEVRNPYTGRLSREGPVYG